MHKMKLTEGSLNGLQGLIILEDGTALKETSMKMLQIELEQLRRQNPERRYTHRYVGSKK